MDNILLFSRPIITIAVKRYKIKNNTIRPCDNTENVTDQSGFMPVNALRERPVEDAPNHTRHTRLFLIDTTMSGSRGRNLMSVGSH